MHIRHILEREREERCFLLSCRAFSHWFSLHHEAVDSTVSHRRGEKKRGIADDSRSFSFSIKRFFSLRRQSILSRVPIFDSLLSWLYRICFAFVFCEHKLQSFELEFALLKKKTVQSRFEFWFLMVFFVLILKLDVNYVFEFDNEWYGVIWFCSGVVIFKIEVKN